jgi:hypothetical protein
MVNKLLKNHLKQMYSEQLFVRAMFDPSQKSKDADHQNMAVHLTRHDCEGFQKVLYIQCSGCK